MSNEVNKSEERIRELINNIKRQYPGFPTTFNTCTKCNNNGARGSGYCAMCYEKELAEIAGGFKAKTFHIKVQELFEIEQFILELANYDNLTPKDIEQ